MLGVAFSLRTNGEVLENVFYLLIHSDTENMSSQQDSSSSVTYYGSFSSVLDLDF